MNDPEQLQGLTNKWLVISALNPAKHASCDFFVLDCVHDKYARAALQAYADACRAEYPVLASDLDAKIAGLP